MATGVEATEALGEDIELVARAIVGAGPQAPAASATADDAERGDSP